MMRDVGEAEEAEVEEEEVEEEEVEKEEVEEETLTKTNKPAVGVAITMVVVFMIACGVLVGFLYSTGLQNPKSKPLTQAVGEHRLTCQANSCSGHGQCYELDPDGLVCVCDIGYTGDKCLTDVDDCEKDPCSSGTCTDLVDDFRCTCDDGYGGKKCDQDLNECDSTSSPCSNHGICVDKVNSYACICSDGYTGTVCETDIDDCEPDPCVHGVCTDLVYDFDCVCDTGYAGKTCANDTNECISEPCVNGTCVDMVDGYTCICEDGFIGELCDDLFLPCSDQRDPLICLNGGNCSLCSNSSCLRSYECECPSGYTGQNCEIPPPIDGGWSEWLELSRSAEESTFSTGDGSCNIANITFTRTCDNPTPADGGTNCTGDAMQMLPVENCTCTACASLTIGIKLCSCDTDTCTEGVDCCDGLESCS